MDEFLGKTWPTKTNWGDRYTLPYFGLHKKNLKKTYGEIIRMNWPIWTKSLVGLFATLRYAQVKLDGKYFTPQWVERIKCISNPDL